MGQGQRDHAPQPDSAGTGLHLTPSPARVEFTPDGRAILTIHPDVAPGHAAKVLREAIAERHPQGVPVRPADLSSPRPDPTPNPTPAPSLERPLEPDLDLDDGSNGLLDDLRKRQEAGQLHEQDALELQTAQRERSRLERWAEGLKAAAAL